MSLPPDPSVISGIHTPVFARLPDPVALFRQRAARLRQLADGARLAPYLRFLADLADVQAALAAATPPPERLGTAEITRNRSHHMPPIDRAAMIASGDMVEMLALFLTRAEAVDMPAPAREALHALRDAPEAERQALLGELACDRVPEGLAAPALFAGAALQLVAARLAATLDGAALVPVGTGVCPACGGLPSVSMVTATRHQEGARYACCATCTTAWNAVRVTCLCCGSTKGIGYRALEEDPEKAHIRAEVCNECHAWVKILYQNRVPEFDAMADDIASLGLDAQMRATAWSRGGFNPFLTGY
ncbi:MAG: formate dehydrogenase accessory protein FdhE [Paracoccus sp. (in: a-proteobacteria)]|nr:formate dehydrogenase accessory protein FdhE [Paracoccus sp. (in: a-proteobacteria)]